MFNKNANNRCETTEAEQRCLTQISVRGAWVTAISAHHCATQGSCLEMNKFTLQPFLINSGQWPSRRIVA